MAANSGICQPHNSIFAIDIQGLTKIFGARLALRGIDLKVKHQEFLAILGPNGAGKTTLIKVLATIMNPSSGKVIIDGLNLKDNALEIHRRIGVVTHQTFLYSTLTAYENLEFYGRMYDVASRKERILEVVEMMGMTSRLHDRVDTFSRGMQQRLSIARALLHKPSIMLLDEPETGLDQQATAMLWKTLQSNSGEKPTIMMITHNLERGLELCNRHIILAKGKIVYDESSQSLNLANLKQAYYEYTRAEV
jgi:heme exporter protein A